jgi:hypothetical protein
MAEVRVADVVVPEIFAPYVRTLTEQKTALVDSGVAPSWRDNDDDSNILADRVSSDDPGVVATPAKIQSNQEVATRLSRNQSWKTMDLAAALAGDDPANAIASNVASYWRRRLQAVFVATWTGIFADNAQVAPNDDPRAGITNNAAQDDLTVDISGAFTPGVTDFSAEAFIDAITTAGDSQGDFVAVMMHSISEEQPDRLHPRLGQHERRGYSDLPRPACDR